MANQALEDRKLGKVKVLRAFQGEDKASQHNIQERFKSSVKGLCEPLKQHALHFVKLGCLKCPGAILSVCKFSHEGVAGVPVAIMPIVSGLL